MKDRNVQFPNRFEIVPVPGTTNIFDVTPAPGAVYEEGTFWNKQNVLKDATAALYGKTAAAVPDEIFAAIRPLITAAQNTANTKSRIESGYYTGTGSGGANSPNSLRFSFAPKLVMLTVEFTPGRPFLNYPPEWEYRGPKNAIWMIDTGPLPTEYEYGFGFTSNAAILHKSLGKKSVDGKIISWYSSESSAVYQFNENGRRYYYVGIG